MSAVPKKKLCWNCEGNVSRVIDNCPYCGVYLHASDQEEEEARWNRSFESAQEDEIPSPLYKVLSDEESVHDDDAPQIENETEASFDWSLLLSRLKQDVFPLLFLMAGSIFFLFGVVLLLFSYEGTLTLQWQSHYSYYFLALAIPFLGFGWKYLQSLDGDKP